MKTKIYSLLIATVALLFVACESIEVRDELANTTTGEAVELTVEHKADGGNEFTLSMNTPGVTGYWDVNIGLTKSDEATVIYPIIGTSSFKFVGTTGAEFFEKTIDVTVSKITTDLDPKIMSLVGDDFAAGKTWVLATDRPAGMAPYDGGPAAMYSFMTADYDWLEFWWNAGDCCPPVDVNAEMNFNFAGAANYTYTNGTDVKTGSFSIDTENDLLTITGADLVGAYGAPGNVPDTKNGVYQLKKISDTEMILYQVHGTGWNWIFKPKGHVYN